MQLPLLLVLQTSAARQDSVEQYCSTSAGAAAGLECLVRGCCVAGLIVLCSEPSGIVLVLF